MAGSQISTSVSIIDSLHGYQALSLTEYNTSAAASICAGSVVEIAGAFFTFAGDEAIEASTWTSIVTGNTAYITLTASGTAGSQIVVAAYTATAPTWRDDLQGWYASAASNVRVIGSVYKAEATNYTPKYIYGNEPDGKYRFTSSLSVLGKISAESSLNVYGKVSFNKGVSYSNNLFGTNVTYGALYSALDAIIPTSGDTILLYGGINGYPCSFANRSSSTLISLYYNHASGSSVLNVTSGGASILTSISVAW